MTKEEFFDRDYIENILSEESDDFANEMTQKIANLLSVAIEDLSERVPFININNTIFQPVNETFNGCFTPLSNFEYFIGIRSPQIQKNCLSYSGWWGKFKDRFITAWHDSKKKKRKKKAETKSNKKVVAFDADKYNIDFLKRDLQLSLVENLTETSIVYNLPNKLLLQGRDDLGSVAKVVIYPVLYDGKKFKYFINKRKGFLNIDMDKRAENILLKEKNAGSNIYAVLKILNNLYRNLCRENANQIFMESIICNIPDDIFKGNDIYEVFVKVINFLKMTDVSEFKSVENPDETIFKNKLTQNMIVKYNKFIRILTEN